MSVKISAGLLMYRLREGNLEIFIAHPGGPFWKNKDDGSWSLPKGEIEKNEILIEAAKREFKEETGITAKGPFIPLDSVSLKSGKIIYAWAFEGDWNGLLMTSSYVKMEWPIGSGKMITFPEVDRAGFFSVEVAQKKLHPAQAEFIGRLINILSQEQRNNYALILLNGVN